MKSFLYLLSTVFVWGMLTSMGCATAKSAGGKNNRVANIDLTHWKVTIPTARADGKAMEVSPPEIFDYATNPVLKEFMYNDSSDGSIVFHAYPASTTANTKYSRSELREQMVSGSNSTNWTFKQGRRMKAKMSIDQVSKDENGKEHRIIIAQIHGRLTNEQRDLIGQKDNNAPPILKIYYDKGKIRVKTKVLKNHSAADKDILDKKAWGDDKGYNFDTPIEKGDRFTLEIIVTEGRMEIVLNGFQKAVYKGKDMDRWGIFENYFKVGNYFQSRDAGSSGKVKLYELEVGDVK